VAVGLDTRNPDNHRLGRVTLACVARHANLEAGETAWRDANDGDQFALLARRPTDHMAVGPKAGGPPAFQERRRGLFHPVRDT
jgi:hypothetical protein